MSKEVDLTRPITDDEREYLLSRSRYYDVEENDRQFEKGKFAPKDEDDVEPVFAPTPTVAENPIEPGSPADNPPQFVGQRPHGVDRAVWGGSTGLTEQEALFDAPEPHAEQKPADDDDSDDEGVDIDDLTEEQIDAELALREVPVPEGSDRDDKLVLLKEALEAEQ